MNSNAPIIVASNLTRRYGAKLALDDVSLAIPRGVVFGLIGVNGAGKTTFIKHVLGLLNAQSGAMRVFGANPVNDPVGVLARIGYLSEENDLPGWMKVSELMRYTRAFYPNWDADYAEKLRRSFELDLSSRIKHLSKGQKARAGLIVALAHRPELLVFDEPSSGLDPIVRRDILGAVVRTIADEGRTVLFSSHLLHEVERVADQVALIDNGRVVFSGELDDVKTTHRMVTIRLAEWSAEPPNFNGALYWDGEGHEWTTICRMSHEQLESAIGAMNAHIVEEHTPNLDDIFAAQIGRRTLMTAVGE